jgi:short-subunit dehydrogenase
MISNRHRRIDVIVNNAGYEHHGALEDLSVEEIKTQFETNFFGAVRLMKVVLPMMRKTKKRNNSKSKLHRRSNRCPY